MRKALVIGIDNYDNLTRLWGCTNDAELVDRVLSRHGDKESTKNFGVRKLLAPGEGRIEKGCAKDAIRELFDGTPEIALLYFAGHGAVEQETGYLLTSECVRSDDGVSLSEIVTIANGSKAQNKLIILDSCHSGIAGNHTLSDSKATLSEGLTILTAAGQNQYASELEGHGVFTRLFVDALEGAAANLLGDITPGSVYAHIDQSLGEWEQRPLFKTNVKKFVSLRKVAASIALDDLRTLPLLFPTKDQHIHLNPSYEPESDSPDPSCVVKFKILQRCNRLNLVVPHGAEHMYYAAMLSKECKLTTLGKHYWSLVKRNLI